jgi:TonB family protein
MIQDIGVRLMAGFKGAVPLVFALGIAATTAAAQPGAIGTGGIQGVVRDSSGLGIIGVEISIPGSSFKAHSDEKGEFVLARVPAGPLTLAFRRLGYLPDTANLMIQAGQSMPLEVRIKRLAINLDPVVVSSRQPLTGWRVGFARRQHRGGGTFITREDIEKRNPGNVTDLFRTIPGAHVIQGGIGPASVRFRGLNCAPLTWLDGAPLNAGEFDLDYLTPRSIEAIEVYPGTAAAPGEFTSPRPYESSCGTILIWSRAGPPKSRKKGANAAAAAELANLVAAQVVYTADQVDQPARQDTSRVTIPDYPGDLFRAGTPGSVLVEFVVDASGQVNTDTFSLVYSTNPAFTDAVLNALRDATYIPAMKNGYPVQQVVQREFRFAVDSAAAATRKP